jgi:hypothetical protein
LVIVFGGCKKKEKEDLYPCKDLETDFKKASTSFNIYNDSLSYFLEKCFKIAGYEEEYEWFSNRGGGKYEIPELILNRNKSSINTLPKDQQEAIYGAVRTGKKAVELEEEKKQAKNMFDECKRDNS